MEATGFVSLRLVVQGLDELEMAERQSLPGRRWTLWVGDQTALHVSSAKLEGTLLAIARTFLLRNASDTFERRNMDRFDFHECYIESIRAALVAAYEYGLAEGKRAR